jgi:hypothetical protein
MPVTTIHAKVLVVIQEKEFMQYPSPMKNRANMRNPNKFCLFHCDHENDIEECHALKKEIERLIAKSYLHQFVRKEKQPELGKEICAFDALTKIK